MKLDKLFDFHVLTGVILGAILGLYHPMEAYKGILVIVGAVMSLKVVGVLK